jgi:hypothetical protein
MPGQTAFAFQLLVANPEFPINEAFGIINQAACPCHRLALLREVGSVTHIL